MTKYPFTIYELETGRIISSGSLSKQSDIANVPFKAETHALIEVETKPHTHYIQDGVAVEIPPQPSKSHAFDYATKEWTLDLDAARQALWLNIKTCRDIEISSGLEYKGHRFDSDERSMQRLTMAAQSSLPVTWTLADNTTINLQASEVKDLASLLWGRFQTLFEKGQQLREKIQQATTQAQLDTITW